MFATDIFFVNCNFCDLDMALRHFFTIQENKPLKELSLSKCDCFPPDIFEFLEKFEFRMQKINYRYLIIKQRFHVRADSGSGIVKTVPQMQNTKESLLETDMVIIFMAKLDWKQKRF
jgi:hypothetical protein